MDAHVFGDLDTPPNEQLPDGTTRLIKDCRVKHRADDRVEHRADQHRAAADRAFSNRRRADASSRGDVAYLVRIGRGRADREFREYISDDEDSNYEVFLRFNRTA